MESLFYFNRAAVSLDDIEAVARATGHRTELRRHGPGYRLVVAPTGGDRWCSWFWDQLSEDEWAQTFEPDDLELISQYQPATLLMIDEHPISWPRLRLLLASILERFGGWIGCDNGSGFDPVLTADTIHTVDDPLYAVALAHARGEAGPTD
jgi:hypothetical protein